MSLALQAEKKKLQQNKATFATLMCILPIALAALSVVFAVVKNKQVPQSVVSSDATSTLTKR